MCVFSTGFVCVIIKIEFCARPGLNLFNLHFNNVIVPLGLILYKRELSSPSIVV